MADKTDAPLAALELRGIEKRFGAVHANRGVSLTVAKGSIHGLVGENGAGKSTLMNIAFGLIAPDAGEVRTNGKIGMVHQHFMLVDEFTVLENVLLGVEDGFQLAGPLALARAELERLGREYGLQVPLDVRVGELAVGLRQRIEIIKALYRRSDVLILDEPTAVLTPQETGKLFDLVRKFRDQGKSVILVTHKLREIMAVTDRVTVMRQGAVVTESATKDTSILALAEAMIGRPLAFAEPTAGRPAGPIALSVKDLVVRDSGGTNRVNGVSLELREGEIVGIAGVSGNGQTELIEAIAGMRRAESGVVTLGGRDVAADGPAARRRLGLAHVPEDRLKTAVVAEFSAAENAMLGYQESAQYNRGLLLDPRAIAAGCEAKMKGYDVRPPNPALPIRAFSGGNQQKLIIARELEANPRVVLVNQPTRGVDIGAIEFIHGRLLEMRKKGCAVLLVSVELDEILALADRILVMSSGVIVGELQRAAASPERLGVLMAGVGALR